MNYEKKLGRAIRRKDISTDQIGFSNIVINRIWGSLGKCKEELGLLKTPASCPRPFEYYKKILDDILNDISKTSNKLIITWKDIENNNLGIIICHKTLTKSFNNNNVDIFKYIKERGFLMNPSSFSFHFTLDSGERVLSSMEYSLSSYLNDCDLIYNIDYKRDVMYKTFLQCDRKINCDYVVVIDNNYYYIEVAGIITNNGNWEFTDYGNEKNNLYRNKMILKQSLLKKNNLNYLILFKNDFINDAYKNKVNEFLNLKGSD